MKISIILRKFVVAGFVGVLFLSFVSGCATTRPMAFKRDAKGIYLEEESVAIFSYEAKNDIRPIFTPAIYGVKIKADNEKGETYYFVADQSVLTKEGFWYKYPVSMQLPPGKYIIKQIEGTSFLVVIFGSFQIPVNSKFELGPREIIYLGHIEAINRKRQNIQERMAGLPIPLVDQIISGYFEGTWNVKIHDNYDEDIKEFKNIYPFLKLHDIRKAILEPWERPLAK